MLRAQLIFWSCLLFAAAVGVYAYFARDWSTLQIDSTSAGSVADLPDSEDFGATVTAVIRMATRTAAAATQASTPAAVPPLTAGGVTVGDAHYRVDAFLNPEPAGFFKPAAGKHIVGVLVTVQAGSSNLRYGFTQFRLVDDAGTEYTWALGNSEPKLDQGSLEAGASKTGWIAFALPDGVEPAAVLVQPAPAGPTVPISALP